MMDTELAKLILKQARTCPETFYMGSWGYESSCGTVACLAGHAMLLSGYRLRSDEERNKEGQLIGDYRLYECPDGTLVEGFYGDEAQRLLQMTDEERFEATPGEFRHDIFLDIQDGLERFAKLVEE
jgi:hypothetical protein